MSMMKGHRLLSGTAFMQYNSVFLLEAIDVYNNDLLQVCACVCVLQMVKAESTILQIEALSESISNLTVSPNTHKLLVNDFCSSLLIVCSNRSSNLSDGNFC